MAWLPNAEKNFVDMFIRFDRIHERDRRTHRLTHRRTSRAYAQHRAAKIVVSHMQVRNASSDVIKETEALTLRTQSANTKRLSERLHDINYWKSELQREITDVIAETDILCQQKLRLENALRATEIPLHIATDNLHCRQRRQGIDLVQDEVEINLLKVRSHSTVLS